MGLKKYIANQFGKPTGIGGKISTLIMNLVNQKQYKKVVDLVSLKKEENKNVLDIGFGNGYLIKKLAKENKGSFYGIDISKDMVDRVILEAKEIKNIMGLMEADVVNLPFENEFFDIAYTVNTVYFWSDLEKSLREIKRVLKKDGVFINVIYSKKWLDSIAFTKYGFTKNHEDDLREKTKEYGFDDVEIVEVIKDKAYCIIARV